ncbi:MAG: PEP-CTERM sorting domain-containing protein [Burkholderiales bacterium]|nr:PEP-CTERM sorting domain-containing protein [Burkholderiales bacterium]
MTSTPRLPLLLATALLASVPAWSATLYSLPAATVALETNTSVTADFLAAAGAGRVDFTLAGYATLDGDNDWIDILHISLNGNQVFSGTWDLGGGGINRVLLDPNGATVGTVSGHLLTISLPVLLAAGSNHLVFSYESPSSFEGVTREPASGALLLAGLGVFGWLAQRRR